MVDHAGEDPAQVSSLLMVGGPARLAGDQARWVGSPFELKRSLSTRRGNAATSPKLSDTVGHFAPAVEAVVKAHVVSDQFPSTTFAGGPFQYGPKSSAFLLAKNVAEAHHSAAKLAE